MSAERASSTLCRGLGCGARILFVEMPSGKHLPVDFEPDPEGRVVVWRDVTGRFLGRMLSSVHPEARPFERRYTAHMATCPALRKKGDGEPVAKARDLSGNRELPLG